MKKKLLSLLLVLAMVLSIIPLPVAAEAEVIATAGPTANLTVNSTWAKSGSTVDVNVSIAENPGIMGAILRVSWDKTMTLLKDASGEAFSNMTYTPPSRYNPAGTNFVWYGNEVGEVKDGTALTLTFQISETAQNNQILPVEITYIPGDIFDGSDQDVELNITNGYVHVVDYIPGDVNNDGKVNTRDLVRLSQYISDGCTTDPEGYNAQVVESACDVNGDGKVNTRDLTRLSQFISDGGVTNPKGYNATLQPAKLPDCTHPDLTATEAKAATCTEDGNIVYWHCANCAKYFGDAEATTEISHADTVLSATGHTEVVDEAVAATCTQTGLTQGSHCAVCNEVLVAQLETGVANHTPGSQATCTEDQICTVCGEILDTANGHVPGVEATCTAPQICTVCSTVLAETIKHGLSFVPERDPVDRNDPGNCAYWQCAVCHNCYLDEDATQEIPLADTAWKLFKVTYYCDESGYKETQWYKVGQEVETLPKPQIDGYTFMFWTDADGKRVNSIAAENTKNLELYATVQVEEYTIYLGGTWNYDPMTYTVEDQIDLPVPVEDGLTFAGWRDADGKVEEYTDSVGVRRWRIPKGTTDDIELMAQWKDNRNLVVPYADKTAAERYVNSGYDETEGYYWFVYSLGEIQNVVLDPESDLIKTKHDGGHIAGSLSLSESTTVEESVAKSVGQTVSHTVTSSTDWSVTKSWENSATAGMGVSVMVGAEVGPDFAKAKVETSINATFEASASVGGEKTDGGGNEESDETSDTIETSFAYNTSFTQAKERTKTFTHDVAPGNYYFANVGTVKVYAFVVFDPVDNTIGLETFSTLGTETTTVVLSDKKANREYVSEALSYDVDIDGINLEITDNFFVQYFANNGTAAGVVKMYPKDTDVQISKSLFDYSGYHFTDWAAADGQTYKAGDLVNNLVGPGQILVLNAQWRPNEYTVTFDSNGGLVDSETKTVIFDGSYGSLPTPERVGYAFAGWKLGSTVVTAATVVNTAKDHTLTAQWTANSYTVTFSANGGSGTSKSQVFTYDTAQALSGNSFERANYTFLGWSTDSNAITPTYTNRQSVKNLATSGNVTLYAIWVKTLANVKLSPDNGYDDVTVAEGTMCSRVVFTDLDVPALKQNGFTRIAIEVRFDCKSENNLFMFNYATLDIIGKNSTLWSGSWHLKNDMSGSWETKTVTLTANISELYDDGRFFLDWAQPYGTGNGETWWLGTTNVKVVVS